MNLFAIMTIPFVISAVSINISFYNYQILKEILIGIQIAFK